MFNQVAVAVSGAIADFEVLRTPTPGMIINAVEVMKYIRPEEPFSREVKKYISILLIQEGIYIPPPSLVELIGEEFELLVKTTNKEEWKVVYNKYKEMLESKKFNIEETPLDIQARRLLVAEEAANEYSK
jgi:predicted nucleic acid-binding protein